jgi:hypothetical protein
VYGSYFTHSTLPLFNIEGGCPAIFEKSYPYIFHLDSSFALKARFADPKGLFHSAPPFTSEPPCWVSQKPKMQVRPKGGPSETAPLGVSEGCEVKLASLTFATSKS